MDLPPPTMIRDFRSHLDQTLDEPLHRPFHFFAHEVELPEHVQEVVGQDPHEQAGLVGCESTATRLVPTQRGLPLFDPVLNVAASVVHLNHFPGRQLGIDHDESDPGKEFPFVPLDLGNYPALSIPSLCLAPEINQPDLNPTLGRPTHGTRQIRLNESVQHRIGRKPDEVRNPLTLAILVELVAKPHRHFLKVIMMQATWKKATNILI